MDGSLLVSIKNSTIIQEKKNNHPVQCNCRKNLHPQNVRVEVMLYPKMDDYIFNGLVLQNNLNRPDIDGSHSLTTNTRTCTFDK